MLSVNQLYDKQLKNIEKSLKPKDVECESLYPQREGVKRANP